VLNYPEVEALLHRLGVKYVDVVTASADNSTMEQLALFNSAGLVLSSHSSQLVNMIVMRHGSQLVRPPRQLGRGHGRSDVWLTAGPAAEWR